MKQLKATGLAAVQLATILLQRIRLTDPRAGLWEAADIQWWWRTPCRSDQTEQLFFVDDEGPVAAVFTTEFHGRWQCDLLRMPDTPLEPLWWRALEMIEQLHDVSVPIRDDDIPLVYLARQAGLFAVETSAIAWMDVNERAPAATLPTGFVLVDRSSQEHKPHPMCRRNGDQVAERLSGLSLYDPGLDIAIETTNGEVAAYALFWLDPVTFVGLLEPMRVEDNFQRRGLGRVLTTHGLACLRNAEPSS